MREDERERDRAQGAVRADAPRGGEERLERERRDRERRRGGRDHQSGGHAAQVAVGQREPQRERDDGGDERDADRARVSHRGRA